MKFRNMILATATAASMAACATVGSPTGGEKDVVPPTLVNSNPPDQALHVKGQIITLTFDEEVQPNNLNRELLITPNAANPYRVRTNKNALSLEFENPLQENTTYTFNFREGIGDITEKNKAAGLKLAFSTGSFIDSSRVTGTVVDLLTQAPEKEAVIALYPTTDTLSIRKNRPYYQGATDDAGRFEMTNIKEGEYRVYALVDKNNNAFYDNEQEKIAYLAQPLRITHQTDTIKLQTIRIDTRKPILLARENYLDRFIANYNEGINSFSARAVGQADSIAFRTGAAGKAIELFKTEQYNGGQTILSAVDSAGNMAVDTIEIAFSGKRAQRIRGAQLKVINSKGGSGIRPGQPVTIELETPVRITGAEPARLMADSVLLRVITYPEEITLDATATELTFMMPTLDDRYENLSITLDSAAIVPLQGEPLSLPEIPVNLVQNGGTGGIAGTANSAYTSYTIQLLTEEFGLVEEIKNVETYHFTDLEPGNYHIRVLVDENNDGAWSSGNADLEQQPEKVYLYPEPIEVRANWELEKIGLEF